MKFAFWKKDTGLSPIQERDGKIKALEEMLEQTSKKLDHARSTDIAEENAILRSNAALERVVFRVPIQLEVIQKRLNDRIPGLTIKWSADQHYILGMAPSPITIRLREVVKAEWPELEFMDG